MSPGWIFIIVAAVMAAALLVAYGLWVDHTTRLMVRDALERGPMTSVELMRATGLSVGIIYVALKRLESRGVVLLEETPGTSERGWANVTRATLTSSVEP